MKKIIVDRPAERLAKKAIESLQTEYQDVEMPLPQIDLYRFFPCYAHRHSPSPCI